jgi:hypothetical protein
MSNQFFDCLKSITKKAVGGAAFIAVITIAAPVALGAVIALSLAVTDKESRKRPAKSQETPPPVSDSTPEPTTEKVDQQRINEALWLQLKNQYSPVKSWQQQILDSIPLQPLQPVVEEQVSNESERSLPSEAITLTPEFPEKPQDFSNEKKWTVRKLQDFCRQLNAIELERNPENPKKITGYASKGTNRRNIVRLINKFYDFSKPATPTAEEVNGYWLNKKSQQSKHKPAIAS